MEVLVRGTDGATSKQSLPSQFQELVRPDLIKKAVHAIQSRRRQRYGADLRAGKRVSADISKRRRKYRGSYGTGRSRIHRKVMSRRGLHFNYVAALAPQAVGGMRAHPPKAEKNWAWKINKKERRKAIRSALAATMFKDIVQARGHKIPYEYPFIAEDTLQLLSKTKEVKKVLASWGLQEELSRSSIKKVRAGKGTMRGRRYKTRKGLLLVVDTICPLTQAAKNIPGIDVILVNNINTELLAPGGVPGRATIFTKKAIAKLEKEKLFV
jgi:large subunit ribosomal protein L4e